LKSATIFQSRVPETFLNGSLSKNQIKQLEELAMTKHFPSLIDIMEGNEDRWI
jgi:hypothetical protein